jgi:hypothetical protein
VTAAVAAVLREGPANVDKHRKAAVELFSWSRIVKGLWEKVAA